MSRQGVLRRSAARIAGRTEAEVHAAVGLPWISPELREDRGEIDDAVEGRLPAGGLERGASSTPEPGRS